MYSREEFETLTILNPSLAYPYLGNISNEYEKSNQEIKYETVSSGF